MFFSKMKIIRVMGRGNLKGTGSKPGIHIIILNNWNAPVCQRKKHLFFLKILEPFIIRVYSNCSISKHGFRPCGGNSKPIFFIHKGIFYIVEVCIFLFIFNFKISKSCFTPWTPVDNILALINQSLFIKSYKYFSDSIGKALIHGKTLTLPVTGSPKSFKLINNGSTGFFTPFPDLFYKIFSAKLIPCQTFFSKIFFNNILGCNPCMICSRHP